MNELWGAWPAHSVEHVTLDLLDVSLSPTLGVGCRDYLKKKKEGKAGRKEGVSYGIDNNPLMTVSFWRDIGRTIPGLE